MKFVDDDDDDDDDLLAECWLNAGLCYSSLLLTVLCRISRNIFMLVNF